MGNEENEEPLEAEIPRVRMNPKNPTSREKQENEDSRHVVYRSWCAACVEGREVGGQHRIELLDEEERERTTPFVAFDYGFLTQENVDTFPSLICRDSKYGQTGATCCERKGPTAFSISCLVGFIKDLGFRRIILNCDNEPSTKALQYAVHVWECKRFRKDHLRVTHGQRSCGFGCVRSETTMQDTPDLVSQMTVHYSVGFLILQRKS